MDHTLSSSKNSDSDKIRSYLLGALPKSRQEEFEERLFTECSLHDDLVASEYELVDDYLTKKLSEQERQQFETHFSITDERRQKVLFGRTFQRYLDSQVLDPQEGLAESVLPGSIGRNQVLAGALVLVLCTGLIGAGWLVYHRKNINQAQRHTIAVILRPGKARAVGNSTQKIPRPPSDTLVGFTLEVGKNEYRKYKAELLRESESLTIYEDLQAQPIDNHFTVEVIVEANLLEEDDYRIKLSGVSDSGQLVPTEEYDFRVNR